MLIWVSQASLWRQTCLAALTMINSRRQQMARRILDCARASDAVKRSTGSDNG